MTPALRRTLLTAVPTAAALAVYQAIAERRDVRKFPPPGSMVDIGGRRIHLWAEGQGSPSVVVLPCLGGAGIEWAGVQRLLREHTTVCLVDRGGLGWSDPAPWPRSFDRMAAELGAALAASDLPRPYVLVGHSTGGLLARLAAARYREQVIALVLVDSSHEDQNERLPALPRRHRLRWRALGLQLTPLWWTRLATRLHATPPPEWLPDDLAYAHTALDLTRIGLARRNRRADVQEMVGMAGDHHALRDEARQLGDLPVTMITAGLDKRDAATWRELQDEIAGYSDNTVRVFADHCGHHVHHDDPQLVADVVRSVVDESLRVLGGGFRSPHRPT